MRYLLWFIIVFSVFFLQGTVSILGVTPNLTAVLAFYAGIRYGEMRGLFAGMFIGGLQDLLSLSLIGPNLLGKGIVGFLSSFFIPGGMLRWTQPLGIIAVCLLTLLDSVTVFISRSLFDTMPAALSTFLFLAIMQSLLNAPAGIFIRPPHAD